MSITPDLKPWAKRPFELIVHAETHFKRGEDYDRRLALISFDNSIEVSISTYLALHPSQRGGRSYPKADVAKWDQNYHSKLDFLAKEIQQRGLPEYWSQPDIVWYHEQRNECYHGSGGGVPERETLEEIRKIAMWAFSVLFEYTEVPQKLAQTLAEKEKIKATIPDKLVVPKHLEMSTSSDEAKALTASALLGQWEEGNDADMNILGRLADGL